MSNEKLSRNDVKVFYIYGEDFIVYYLSSTRIDIIFKIGNFFKSLYEIWIFILLLLLRVIAISRVLKTYKLHFL